MFAVLTCNPALFVYQSLGLVPDNRLLLPNIDVFGYPFSSFPQWTKKQLRAENLQFRQRKCVSIRRSSLICVAHLQVYTRTQEIKKISIEIKRM